MNKYQEALIYFCNGCHHEYEEGNYGQCKRVEGRCGHYKSLKEACDKAEKYDEINRVYLKNEVMESADINAERLQQLYEDMQPFIDKATPFIGSIMNKYQEAINELYKQRAERYKVHQKHKDWSKEIKEYDKVGEALETLQELVDKETPKRPKRKRLYYNCHNGECDKTFIHYCPICNFSSVEKNYANYCPNCGQKLDWSDEDV